VGSAAGASSCTAGLRPAGGPTRTSAATHHLRGNTVCHGGLVLPVQLTNQAVLAAVEQEVLHPEVVRRAIGRAIDELNAPMDTVVPRRTALQAELGVLDQELPRLAAAVAQGGDLTALVEGIQVRERRRRALQAELAGLEGLPPVTARDLQQIQQDAEARLADWRGLLGRHVAQSRVQRAGIAGSNYRGVGLYKDGGGSNRTWTLYPEARRGVHRRLSRDDPKASSGNKWTSQRRLRPGWSV
jgi:hypothetical protein